VALEAAGSARTGVDVAARTQHAPATSRSIWSRGFVYIFVINLAINMAQFMTMTLVPKLAVALGASSVTVGVVSGMFAVTALSVRPVVGPATLRLRKNHLLAGTVGIILLAFVLYSVADDVPVLMAARLLHGAGMGFLAPVMLALASENLPERRMASGIGIFSLGQAVATAAGPSIGLALLSVAGYRRTFLVGAALMAVTLVMALRVRSEPREGRPRWQFSRSTFVAREALVPAIVMFFLAGAYSGVNAFIVLYGESVGVGGIGLFFTAYAVCVLVSRPVAGRIADRYGLSMVIIPGMLIFGAAFVAVSYARSLTDFVVAGAISAFGYGICQPAIQTLSLMSVDRLRRGVAGNTNYMGVDLGYLLMPVAAGWVVSLVEGQGAPIADAYSVMYRVMVVPVLVGLLVFLIFGRKVARKASLLGDDTAAVDDA
jgi:MFS family permease